MIRLATVGTSAICDSFLSGAALTNKFTLTAVFSRNLDTGEAFALKHNCKRVFTNLLEMAKSPDIDAVYIASPNSCHAEQSRIFLENGKHVICEKPIVTKLGDYKKLKRIADENNLIYMEAIIPRFSNGYTAIKSALEEIGEISMAKFDFCQRSSRLDAHLRGEKVNIFDISLCAGALMDIGIYCVYGAVDLLGVPQKITAEKYLLENKADGSGFAIFDYGSFPALLTYSKTAQGVAGSEIIGKNGSLKISMISQYAGVSLIKDGKTNVITENLTKAEQMRGEAERFADYILNFKEFEEDYISASDLCYNVHKCMDIIKKKANLIYPKT